MSGSVASRAPWSHAGFTELEPILIPGWPKLAWVAILHPGKPAVSVFHGPCVETKPHWCAEAAWPGDFEGGDFDRTDIVVGSGLRLREGKAVFVTSGDTLNRLCWYKSDQSILVSNSLAALLAVADLELIEGYPYAEAMASIQNGLESYAREVPTNRGPLHIVYLDNIVVDGNAVSQVNKPACEPAFPNFGAYRDFLFTTAKRIGSNAVEAGRKYAVCSVATISSGYDSPAAAVVAREAGVRRAVTIERARRDLANLFDPDDSGIEIARHLGMSCTSYSRDPRRLRFEDACWAAMGNVADVGLSLLHPPEPVCLLFTGFMGDVLWDTSTRRSELLHRKDTSGARFGEARLEQGVLLCSPVFWGCREEQSILALARSTEMAPWRLGGRYDRPVPRRLLEEAGVRRGAFAKRKRASSFNRRFARPLSPELRADFARFMRARGSSAGTLGAEFAAYLCDGINHYLLGKLPTALHFKPSNWTGMPSGTDFFLWSTDRLKRRYRACLPA